MSKLNDHYKILAAKTTIAFLAVLIIAETALMLLNLLFLVVMGASNLDTTKLFIAFKPFMIPSMVIESVILIGYISYRFIRRPLEYLDKISESAQALANPTEVPIVLPLSLKRIENELNAVRVQTLENKRASTKSEQQKSDLLVYLAHDLKTPLTSVLGYLRLLKDEPELKPELIKKYSRTAYVKAERLEALINEFFEITRFSTNKLVIEASKVNLSRMLRQIANEFIPLLNEKGLTWELNISDNIELVCDSDKLERAIDNLIRNAINYSYPQTVILLSVSDTSSEIEITIQNEGDTIPKEKLERIFEQFYRLDSSRSSSTGGAGLGLAITREIICLHKGTITVASENNHIRFTISLPNCKNFVRSSS